jgi:hypothetical protein
MTKITDALKEARPPETADSMLNHLVATKKALTGVQSALAHLRAIDEEAGIIWSTSGPRKSRTEEIAGIMVEIGDVRRVVTVLGFDSGAWKLFAEVPGKGAEAQIQALKDIYAQR